MLCLFADQVREAKLHCLGNPLVLLDKHVDFAALAAEVDRWAPQIWISPRYNIGLN